MAVKEARRWPSDRRPAVHVKREPNNGAITVGFNLVFPHRWFHGRIDELALFNRALTASEIAAKQRALNAAEPRLVAAYHFDGDTRDLKAKHDGQLVSDAKLRPPGS